MASEVALLPVSVSLEVPPQYFLALEPLQLINGEAHPPISPLKVAPR